MPEAFCFRVCPSVSESVRPVNLVNTMSQKTIKGISPNFGHRCIWIHGCACYSAPVLERNIAIILSVCPLTYLWNRWTNLREFLCRSPVAMARSSGVAIRYVLPVLWMTSTHV